MAVPAPKLTGGSHHGHAGLSAPVGPSCPNQPHDVLLVQTLLNRTGAVTSPNKPLAVDRTAGPLTFSAIKDFQTAFKTGSDGIIAPASPTFRKLADVANEFSVVLSTVYGEAARSSAIARKAILCVMQNRVGYREWSRYRTLLAIVENTGFDAYTQKIAPYNSAFNYMNGRSAAHVNAHLEGIVAGLRPCYITPIDIASKAVLYYSPKAQSALHKSHPKSYAAAPKWDFTQLKEVAVPGLLATDDFKFYAYK